MLESLKHIDTELFLYLNSFHNGFFDVIMLWLSKEFVWAPFYAFLLYLAYKIYAKHTLWVLVFVILLITASDQLSVHLFKEVFLRYRPCHNTTLQNLVHLVNGHCGGKYGFISSHAANTFALALFLITLFKGKYKHFAWLMLIWAGMVSYSRIYLGVHYPADIVCGALFGALLGAFFGKLFFAIQKRLSNE